MSHQKQSRNVYYHVVQGNHYIFADERNKRKLLEILHKVQQTEGWFTYAFCITDTRAFFITESRDRKSLEEGIRNIFSVFVRQCRGRIYLEEDPFSDLIFSRPRQLISLEQIVDYCRFIHQLPVQEGYTARPEDYWWSSYISYSGTYKWKFVDCRVISMYFSPDSEVARARFHRFHKNPVTSGSRQNAALY